MSTFPSLGVNSVVCTCFNYVISEQWWWESPSCLPSGLEHPY